MKTLILGGVRSGKSRLAEKLAKQTDRDVVFIATAKAGDEEMQRRIDAHRSRRPKDWIVVEEPYYLGAALEEYAIDRNVVIVDCLTLWLTNLIFYEDPSLMDTQCSDFLERLNQLSTKVILVSNEINMGVHPMGEISRQFCDRAGVLHQQVAEVCDQVILTVAGLPQIIKPLK